MQQQIIITDLLGFPLEIHQMLILTASALLAGFIDAVVGGGGLIQLPALLMTLPNCAIAACTTPLMSIATLFETNKIASIIYLLTAY